MSRGLEILLCLFYHFCAYLFRKFRNMVAERIAIDNKKAKIRCMGLRLRYTNKTDLLLGFIGICIMPSSDIEGLVSLPSIKALHGSEGKNVATRSVGSVICGISTLIPFGTSLKSLINNGFPSFMM